MRVKKWSTSEVDEIADYLVNVASNVEVILKLRNRKGVRCTTLDAEVAIAVKALRSTVAAASRNGGAIDPAFESWIGEYIVDGGREKLIAALRQRRQRSDSPDPKPQTDPSPDPDPAPKPEPEKSGARIRRLIRELDSLSDDEALVIRAYLDSRFKGAIGTFEPNDSKRDRHALIERVVTH